MISIGRCVGRGSLKKLCSLASALAYQYPSAVCNLINSLKVGLTGLAACYELAIEVCGKGIDGGWAIYAISGMKLGFALNSSFCVSTIANLFTQKSSTSSKKCRSPPPLSYGESARALPKDPSLSGDELLLIAITQSTSSRYTILA